MLVYYFTGALFALSNLALRRIKVSRFEDLNDPFELLGVDLANSKHRAVLRDKKKEINRDKSDLLQRIKEESTNVGSPRGGTRRHLHGL